MTCPPNSVQLVTVNIAQVCTYLEKLTADLEASAHPALDALTAEVYTHNRDFESMPSEYT